MKTRSRYAVPSAHVVDRMPLPSRRARILECELDPVTMNQAVDRIASAIGSRSYCRHVAINAAKLVALQHDVRLRDFVNSCELVTADGQAVVWASRLLRDPVPERVTGIDLMEALFARAEERGWRVYILGARHDVLVAAVQRIRDWHPGLSIAGWRDGYFEAGDDGAVAESIRRTGAQLLFVAISSPRKEYFLATYGRAVGAPFVMGVGGAIDVVAGRCRRAPVLWQRLGLEWLFRLGQEPLRLSRRYATTNLRFLLLVAREFVGQRAVVGVRGPLLVHRSVGKSSRE
jgi:N-acetylglucosaminyldiphosphoundecaprenol N-acetyl-beta-D-mannosaminyltransferase